MEVKIYREKENEILLIDEGKLAEYNNLVNKLNLKNEIDQKIPPVYVPINSSITKLLKALCPSECDIKEYKKSTIPVEVLKIVDNSINNEMYDGYTIWYADKNPDPLLIGWKWQTEEAKLKGYFWMKDLSLIARWGDCALELDDLLKKGFESIKISLIDSAKEVLQSAKSVIENPDLYVRKHLKSDLILPKFETDGSSNFGEIPF